MAVRPIPEGYHSVTPYLIVRGGARAIEFYKKAFGATEVMSMPGPDGKIGHAEIRIHIRCVRDHQDVVEQAAHDLDDPVHQTLATERHQGFVLPHAAALAAGQDHSGDRLLC